MPINVTSEAYNAVKNSPPPLRKTKKQKLEPSLGQQKEIENKVLDSVQVIKTENFSFENRPHVLVTGDKNLELTKVRCTNSKFRFPAYVPAVLFL